MTMTWRAEQKATRRAQLLRSAAALFAERGFASVSTSDLGEAVGISGPALYKHFASKEAVLVELLVGASEELLAGCRRILAERLPASETLRRLVAFHLEFATSDPDVIRIQDRELAALPTEQNHRVRQLQREYVQEWDAVLAALEPAPDPAERQTRLLAVFGLLNSTPFSAHDARGDEGRLLERMALAALLVRS
jgi:AcrR family transcriptional regulator